MAFAIYFAFSALAFSDASAAAAAAAAAGESDGQDAEPELLRYLSTPFSVFHLVFLNKSCKSTEPLQGFPDTLLNLPVIHVGSVDTGVTGVTGVTGPYSQYFSQTWAGAWTDEV